MIYLDNNATTRVADEVMAAMQPYATTYYGNPHSAHSLGRAAHKGLENARSQVAALLGCAADRVRFTSCGTESNAIVLRGAMSQSERRKVIATAVEHPSILNMLRRMQSRGEIELVVIGVDRDGAIDLESLAAAADERTRMICVMLAQNETGVLHPVRQVAGIARRVGAEILVDAVQAAGKVPLDVDELDADYLTISGHKLHAPKGIGAIYVREGRELDPLWLGGGQEFGLRSGTEPVSLAVGLGTAAALAAEHLPVMEDVRKLRDTLEDSITSQVLSARVTAQATPRLPNTSSISFPGVPASLIVASLDTMHEVCASAGAACDSGPARPSATLTAMGIDRELAIGAVRFSLSRYTTADEIASTAAAVVTQLAQTHADSGGVA